jgi:hypothetical protein
MFKPEGNVKERDQIKVGVLNEICKILAFKNLSLAECKEVIQLVDINLDLAAKHSYWQN